MVLPVRAGQALQMIRAAILEAGGNYACDAGAALLHLYALAEAGCRKTPVAQRTRAAAEVLGIQPRTFQRLHQDEYIENVALKLYDMVA
jgi:hypothetical protein